MREAALRELEKVFQLCRDGVTVEMFSGYIDSVWHSLADHDGRVWEFGSENADVVHLQEKEQGLVEFVEEYEKRWGRLPDVWFADAEGNLNREQKVAYEEFGTIIASWNCTPGMQKITDLPTISDILEKDNVIVRVPFDIPNVPKQDSSIPDGVKRRIPNITPEKRI